MEQNKIKKGEQFICLKDFYFHKRIRLFVEGRMYVSNADNCIETKQGYSLMFETDNWKEYFTKI